MCCNSNYTMKEPIKGEHINPMTCKDMDKDTTANIHNYKTALWMKHEKDIYEGWNFNFGNTPLDWIQELLE